MAFHLRRSFLSAIALFIVETSANHIAYYVPPVNAYNIRPADFSVACSNYALEREGRYICMENGTIRCLAGWKDEGAWCQIPVCGPQCTKPNGKCLSPGNCVCEIGYYGEECENCNLLPGCLHGYCTKAFECICQDGWKGQFCEKPKCRVANVIQRVDNVTRSDKTSLAKQSNDSGDGDCHHGYCTEPNGECKCNNGWSGSDCTVCIPLPGCNNTYGYCDEPMECKCRKGWTGSFCNIEYCNTSGNCVNGKCIDGICKCDIGWKGEKCDTCVTYPECEHGTCNLPWECTCIGGWTGHLCNNSMGNEFERGKCIDGICKCSIGWKGEKCDTCIPYPECKHGTCNHPRECNCIKGWMGHYCNISVDMSTTIPTTTSTTSLDMSTTNPINTSTTSLDMSTINSTTTSTTTLNTTLFNSSNTGPASIFSTE